MSSQTLTTRPNTAAKASSRTLPSSLTPVARAGTASGGGSLDRKTQREMSARFGHDFSSVRIHADSRAGESAEMLGANAYALGGDIVFGAGKYQPGSRETDRLLAHELTHVVQQARFGLGEPGRRSAKGDASESEAESLSSQILAGRSVEVNTPPGAAIACDGEVCQEPDPSTQVCSVDQPDPVEDQPDPTPAPTNSDADGTGGAGGAGPSSDGAGGGGGIPQLSTPANDALGIALGACGAFPGPLNTACTLASGAQSLTQSPPNPSDPTYKQDQAIQDTSLALTGLSLAGVEAAGPMGLVAAGGVAAGHGVQWLGGKMIEGGIENNPGQFGPDPMDSLLDGQQGY